MKRCVPVKKETHVSKTVRFSKHKRHHFDTIFLTGSKLPGSRLTLFFSKLKVKGSYRLNHNCLPWLSEMVILGCYNTVRTELLEDLVLYVFSGFINKSSVLCIGLSLYNNFHSFFRNSLLSFLSLSLSFSLSLSVCVFHSLLLILRHCQTLQAQNLTWYQSHRSMASTTLTKSS